MKNGLDVFEFNQEDELAEFAAGKLLEKFKTPQPGDSPSLKYQILQNFCVGNDSREEMENVPCGDGDAVEIGRSCDDAHDLATEAQISMATPDCKSKFRNREEESDYEEDNHVSRRFSIELGSKNCFEETLSPSRTQLDCSLSNSPSSPEHENMMSADDGSCSNRSTSTSASDVAGDDDLLKGSVENHCFNDEELDNINTAVTISPDYVVLRNTYCAASLVTFSCSGVKIKRSSTNDEDSFTYEWRVEEIVNIEYNWFQKVGLVMLKLHVLLKDENHIEHMRGTSDIEEVKIAVVEQDWPERQGKINALNVKYSAVWKALLDCNTEETENKFSHLRHYFPSFDDNFKDVVYPKGDPDAVSICKRDVDLLQPENFVNDTIIDFYIKYLKNHIQPEEKHRYHFFNSFFFRKLADLDKDPSSIADGKAAFQRVRKWTRKVDIFGKDLIFIPVNFNLHWSLIVICHLGEVAHIDENSDSLLQAPCVLHMDSIRGSHAGLKNLFQSYLCEEWRDRHNETSEDIASKFLNLRFVSLELPQQENSFDCGLFLLHYLELFLAEAPAHFSPFKINRVSNFLTVDWFPPAEASLKRTLIQKLIFELLENHSSDASNDEKHSSESPAMNENDSCDVVFPESCGAPNVCHKNVPGLPYAQGIEMTLLERSSMRNLHGVGDSGLVLKELFDSGAAPASLAGQFQPFDNNLSQTYHHNEFISPREKVNEETGEQLFCFASGENNFQMAEIAAAGSSLSFSSRGFDAETSWNLGFATQTEQGAGLTSETSSACASDDSDDVGIIENHEADKIEAKESRNEQSRVINTASANTESAPDTSAVEASCVAVKCHSTVPTSQDDVDFNGGSTEDSEMADKNEREDVEATSKDGHLSTEPEEERATKGLEEEERETKGSEEEEEEEEEERATEMLEEERATKRPRLTADD